MEACQITSENNEDTNMSPIEHAVPFKVLIKRSLSTIEKRTWTIRDDPTLESNQMNSEHNLIFLSNCDRIPAASECERSKLYLLRQNASVASCTCCVRTRA